VLKGPQALDARTGVTVVAVNNLVVGRGLSIESGAGSRRGNAIGRWPDFVLPQRDDYRLRWDSPLLGSVVSAGEVDGEILTPTAEYSHPRQIRPIETYAWAPGAFQISEKGRSGTDAVAR